MRRVKEVRQRLNITVAMMPPKFVDHSFHRASRPTCAASPPPAAKPALSPPAPPIQGPPHPAGTTGENRTDSSAAAAIVARPGAGAPEPTRPVADLPDHPRSPHAAALSRPQRRYRRAPRRCAPHNLRRQRPPVPMGRPPPGVGLAVRAAAAAAVTRPPRAPPPRPSGAARRRPPRAPPPRAAAASRSRQRSSATSERLLGGSESTKRLRRCRRLAGGGGQTRAASDGPGPQEMRDLRRRAPVVVLEEKIWHARRHRVRWVGPPPSHGGLRR
jgi:hypothetical protein